MLGVLLPPPGNLHNPGCPPQPPTQQYPDPPQPSPAPPTASRTTPGCRIPGRAQGARGGGGGTPPTLHRMTGLGMALTHG